MSFWLITQQERGNKVVTKFVRSERVVISAAYLMNEGYEPSDPLETSHTSPAEKERLWRSLMKMSEHISEVTIDMASCF